MRVIFLERELVTEGKLRVTKLSPARTRTHTSKFQRLIPLQNYDSLVTDQIMRDIDVRFIYRPSSLHHLHEFYASRALTMAAFCIFTLLLLLVFPPPSASTNSEGTALHFLRSNLQDPTHVLQSWDPTLVDPCTWFHVTCGPNNWVVRLDLGNSNISGTLVPEIGQLEHLQYLELYKNDLRGKIPEELGKLKGLVSIDLYDNKLEGEIPRSFAKLKSLKFLRLSNNRLTGSIPRELTLLRNLRVFDVANNMLCGTIPVDGPFATFSLKSFENNNLNGPELKGLVPYDFGC